MTLRIGVAGLGRAFTLMLPTFRADSRVRLVAATDPRAEACARFAQDFAARVHSDVTALCHDPEVDVVYIATPHQHHAEHAIAAARCGKHVLVEKPMAISLAAAQAMVEAAEAAGTVLLVGHSHSFDAPVLRARALLDTGGFGAVRMINALNFTDYMYRPRRPEELVTAAGGGVIFSQAAHQLDIVRLLGGGRLATLRAHAGTWDASRPTEGAYAAFLTFADGACANLAYSGYAHYDSDELMQSIGEMGFAKHPGAHGVARRALAQAHDAAEEAAQKNARNYGGVRYAEDPARETPSGHQHFGFVLVSCERADLRLTPHGVAIYGDDAVTFEGVPLSPVPRAEVIDELCASVCNGAPAMHDGRWAMATLEACIALLQSSREGREIALVHQVPADPRARS